MGRESTIEYRFRTSKIAEDEGSSREGVPPTALTIPMSNLFCQRSRERGFALRGAFGDSKSATRGAVERARLVADAVTVGAPGPLREIVAVVLRRTGTDFSRYRQAIVERRIRNRMISLGLEDAQQYLACLLAEPEETSQLVGRLTIKVSRFYRNRAVFDCLRRDVLPALVRRAQGRPLRVWSAGCAFGEEAYSLAMLLQESGCSGIVDASDLDPKALEQARRGVYSDEACWELPDDLRSRYLTPAEWRGNRVHRVRSVLRDRVRFLQQDLTTLTPMEGRDRYDLVCCRNVLIYLERPAQLALFSRVFSSVAPSGFLCLGEAEWPPSSQAAHLRGLGRNRRVFQKADENSRGGSP